MPNTRNSGVDFLHRRDRTMGPEGQGSPGDVRDRFRNVYKPGARTVRKPGLASPMESIRAIGGMFKRKQKR